MGYYVGNGVYDYLTKCGSRTDFFWTSGDLWLLVYGDENYEPKVLTVASGNKLNVKVTEEEKAAVSVAKQITNHTRVPVNFIRFDPDRAIEQVRYWEQGMNKIPIISSSDLKKRFSQYGLRMNEMGTHKSINDKSSSPYHDWQRTNMGDSVVVADIDLLRFDHVQPAEIIELKRSYIDLEKWAPYQQDYKNFILISKLARKRELKFYIVYNHRTKNPFYDDVSRLKIFEFDHRMQNPCKLLGYQSIGQFAESCTKKEI